MLYLIAGLTLLLFGGVAILIHFKFPKVKHLIVERIFVFLLMAVFAFRFFSFIDIQTLSVNYEAFASFGGPNENGFLNTMGNLLIWFEYTAILYLLLRPFFNFKTAKWGVKYVSTSIFVLSFMFLKPMLLMLQGNEEYSILYFTLPIEIGLSLALSIYFWLNDFKVHISKHSYIEVAMLATFINFATMPSYIPSFLFGLGNINHHVYDFSFYHRLFIYVLLIVVPFSIYFALRRAHKDKIQYTMIFIAIGCGLSFLGYTKYDAWMHIWSWPWHLCNMATILIPVCFIFNLKKLFYFTYFINVFGAVLAMLMPNYSESATVLAPNIIMFWYNHASVFFLPIVAVSLHMFDRPKLKQYFYSVAAFFVYYVLIVFLNAIFGAYGHSVDFLFINSTFIADKLGDWAKNIFKITAEMNINDHVLVFHPVYQLIYFSVYILLGFGVWFIYQLGFDIGDRHYALHMKLKGIRIDHIALKSVLNGRSLSEPMEGNVGVKLELKDFSKKYGLNTYYAVNDINLEVHAGEVFGFLGPNGAGKSTIIKSIVGIQPITSGEIFVCGYNVKSQPVYAKSQIGFVPDHYALYEKLTGREYLNYIADIYEVSKEERDERLSKYVSLFELEGSIDNKIKTYSHGMKQKVTIIAALIHNPKVWILDEPLTGLDPTSIFQVKECMRKHASEGNIVFFSSHLIDIVEKLCDRIAIIKHGSIECIKTVSEIEATGKTLEEFYMDIIGSNENDPRIEVQKEEK